MKGRQPWQLGTRVSDVCITSLSCLKCETAQLKGCPLKMHAPLTSALNAM